MAHIELFTPSSRDEASSGSVDIKIAYGEDTETKSAFALLFVDAELPRLVHWGRPLAHPDSLLASYAAQHPQRVSGALDETSWPSILPSQAESWSGASRLSVSRDGRELFVKFAVHSVAVEQAARASGESVPSLVVKAQDSEQGVNLTWTLEIDAQGLLRQRASIANSGEGALSVKHVELGFSVPDRAREILTTTGRHLRERSPQRTSFAVGRFEKNALVGRPDFDASLLLTAGVPGFGFEHGEVYATHVGWSGNSVLAAERTPYTQGVIGGGERLFDGEMVLQSCQDEHDDFGNDDIASEDIVDPATQSVYRTPWVYGAYGEGLNEVAARFHGYVRQAHRSFASRPRPVILNTWEAVYFQHDYDTLANLADKAAQVGVERFVVDDGWFGSRRNDERGLGDWQISPQVWPEGPKSLAALAQHVHSKGMEFGLWFEPEMVNPDSDMARKHPDWILAPTAGRLPMQGRNQQVVDLTNPDAFAYIYRSIDVLIDELGIDYIKWDHNKLVTEAVSPRSGLPAVHRQTLAVYKIFHDLKAAHPGLEIESCSSGGGRIDLGILEHADRVWASDCVDPVERADIQRYTSLLVPPEMIGEHVGDSPAHSTGRATSLQMRAATAFFGHMGVEWNLLKQDQADLDVLGDWIAEYKRRRDDFHSGAVVHADSADASVRLDGVVSADKARATYRFTQLTSSQTYPAAPVCLPGLDPQALYQVRPLGVSLNLDVPGLANGQTPLLWWNEDGVQLDGEALQSFGIRPPSLNPAQAVMFEAVRV